jgi:hypothetical protein
VHADMTCSLQAWHSVLPPGLSCKDCTVGYCTSFPNHCTVQNCHVTVGLYPWNAPLCHVQSCYWVNETARKEMLIRWSEAFSRALLVHCR